MRKDVAQGELVFAVMVFAHDVIGSGLAATIVYNAIQVNAEYVFINRDC